MNQDPAFEFSRNPRPRLTYAGELDINDSLTCPVCNCENLHQDAVRVYSRAQEDGESTCIVVDGNDVTFEASSDKNPSARREGLTIDMGCEGCLSILRFGIIQHKGNTTFGWAVIEADPLHTKSNPAG